ncbi:hypothetical protein GCM10009627_30730 [Curtobacterium herbarum]|uniref:Uncharacterized protein n=1 Tax=Curtobacterium herbarum TaxID=150122 RepID=A0ABN1ZGP8_9MICO|nr:hypothetical protein [Curtobacterium herbarum]
MGRGAKGHRKEGLTSERPCGYIYDHESNTIIPNPSYPCSLIDPTLTEEKGNDYRK